MAAIVLPVVLALLAAAPAPAGSGLDAARAHLKAGRFELVLDDLTGSESLPAAQVAEVWGAAATMALEKGDRGLASLYCEMGLRREKSEPRSLRACLRAAVEDGRIEQAEEWGDQLGRLEPKDVEVALLRARAARARGGWDLMVVLLEPFERDEAGSARVAPLLAEARGRQAGAAPADSADAAGGAPAEADLQKVLDEAARQARDAQGAGEGQPAEEVQPRPAHEVVLYSAPWCGVCRRARLWLKKRKVDFEEKDIEKSGSARREMFKKCEAAGVGTDAVPVIVVDGELMVGFDAPRLAKLLELD